MQKIAKQYLRVYPEGGGLAAGPVSMTVVEPDTKCPECGRPWKKGAFYAHRYCCGCSTCGFSTSLFDIDTSFLEK